MNPGSRPEVLLCAGIRTPFARAFGAMLGLTADDLARHVLVESLRRSGVDPGRLDEVIVGCGGQPVEAMNLARVAALRAGIPEHVPAFTVQRNCASGLEALLSARARILSGDAQLVQAAGAESMSEAPFKLDPDGQRKLVRLGAARGLPARLRAASRLRPRDLVPRPTLRQALTDPISGLLMGRTAEVLAREMDIPRAEQDAYASESQRRAAAARRERRFELEIAPILAAGYRKLIAEDDGIREDATEERLARLKPVFERRFGTVTVGNSCQLTDGAAAMLVADGEAAAREGIAPMGVLRDGVTVGCSPRRMGLGPAVAIPRLLERNGLSSSEIDLWEINEAFAVQVLACLRAMGDSAPPRDRLNVCGGAIALGHPVGATGIRIVLTLLIELRKRNLRLGVASLCVGGGQGVAVLVENPEVAA